jgi:hypothetical protein
MLGAERRVVRGRDPPAGAVPVAGSAGAWAGQSLWTAPLCGRLGCVSVPRHLRQGCAWLANPGARVDYRSTGMHVGMGRRRPAIGALSPA